MDFSIKNIIKSKEKHPEIFRTSFHMLTPVYCIYYFINWEKINIDGRYIVLLIVGIIALTEAIRLNSNKTVFGMRNYESKRIGGYAWGGFGVAFVLLFLGFEEALVILINAAIIDPLCRVSRCEKKKFECLNPEDCKCIMGFNPEKLKCYPYLPFIVSMLIYIILCLLFSPLNALLIFIMPAVTVISESPRHKIIDDNFLIIVIPSIVLILTGMIV